VYVFDSLVVLEGVALSRRSRAMRYCYDAVRGEESGRFF